MKFQENPFSGSLVVPCRRTDGRPDGHYEANIAFRNFESGPKTQTIEIHKNGTRNKQNKINIATVRKRQFK